MMHNHISTRAPFFYEPPFQKLAPRTLASTIGFKELSRRNFWLSLLVECLSCCLYVFVVCSTRISWTGSIIGHEPNLFAMALASGLAMNVLLYSFKSVHVNPALTVAMFVTGRIPLIRTIAYVIVHCIAAVAATVFLYSVSVKGHSGALGLDNPHEELASWQILTIEAVISFIVTFATFSSSTYSSYADSKSHILNMMRYYLHNSSSEREEDSVTNMILERTPSPYETNNFHSGDIHRRTGRSKNHFSPLVTSSNQNQISVICNSNNNNNNNNITNATFATSRRSPYNNNINKDLMLMTEQNNQTTKQFYANDYYSQVYEDYTDPKPLAAQDQIGLDNPFHQQDSGYSNTSSSNNNTTNISSSANNNNMGPNNNLCAKTLPSVIEYDVPLNERTFVLMANGSNTKNPRGIVKNCSQTFDDYNNHRIYATQHFKSALHSSHEDNSLESFEQAMNDESQLLAPNGFPIRVHGIQAFIIGLAYTLTSLSMIPASGASLNPARSFGPAFIMNSWSKHWIFWTGPILGAIIASLLYDFIFNPTSKSALCYQPRLFRLSALDVAKTVAHGKSRQDQYRKRSLFVPTQSSNNQQAYLYKVSPSDIKPLALSAQQQHHKHNTIHVNDINTNSAHMGLQPQHLQASALTSIRPTTNNSSITANAKNLHQRNVSAISLHYPMQMQQKQQQQHQQFQQQNANINARNRLSEVLGVTCNNNSSTTDNDTVSDNSSIKTTFQQQQILQQMQFNNSTIACNSHSPPQSHSTTIGNFARAPGAGPPFLSSNSGGNCNVAANAFGTKTKTHSNLHQHSQSNQFGVEQVPTFHQGILSNRLTPSHFANSNDGDHFATNGALVYRDVDGNVVPNDIIEPAYSDV